MLMMFFLKYLPFSLHWTVRYCIGQTKTMLDLGCGDGSFTKDIIYGESWKITGVELYKDSLEKADNFKVYDRLVKADITKLPRSITSQIYDTVLLMQVIEHLEKQNAVRLIKEWEKLAAKKIIISTSVGFIEFNRVEVKKRDKNKLQEHLSGWEVEDFAKRGYRVYGQGLKFVWGDNGLIRKLPSIFWPILILISYIISPLVFFFPKLGTYMVAVKNLE